MKILERVLLGITCFVICTGLLFAVSLSCVYNQAHMTTAFETYARETREDVKLTDYQTIARQIVKYLSSGKEENLPKLNDQLLFSEKENLHLKDCSLITRTMGYIRYGAIVLVSLLIIWMLIKKDPAERKKRVDLVYQSFSAAAAVLTAVILSLIVWGMIDFDSLFLTFHRVFFTNDLWLLNPDTDLLIQMMPQEFFVDYVKYILKTAAPILLLIFAAPVAYLVMKRKTRKAEKA